SVGFNKRKSILPVVDLPHPLSPTMPNVSPFLTLKLIPSTALISDSSLDLFDNKKYFLRFLIFNILSDIFLLTSLIFLTTYLGFFIYILQDRTFFCTYWHHIFTSGMKRTSLREILWMWNSSWNSF